MEDKPFTVVVPANNRKIPSRRDVVRRAMPNSNFQTNKKVQTIRCFFYYYYYYYFKMKLKEQKVTVPIHVEGAGGAAGAVTSPRDVVGTESTASSSTHLCLIALLIQWRREAIGGFSRSNRWLLIDLNLHQKVLDVDTMPDTSLSICHFMYYYYYAI